MKKCVENIKEYIPCGKYEGICGKNEEYVNNMKKYVPPKPRRAVRVVIYKFLPPR